MNSKVNTDTAHYLKQIYRTWLGDPSSQSRYGKLPLFSAYYEQT